MTKRERAAKAARWRRVASFFDKWQGESQAAVAHDKLRALCRRGNALSEMDAVVGSTFAPDAPAGFRWPDNERGWNCRVVAACLLAAMYESGEFDD